MLSQSIIHANFSVDDLEAAKDFYVNKLGFKVVQEGPVMMMLEAGNGSRVNIYEKVDHTPWESTVLGLQVNDLLQAIDELAKNEIEIEKLPITNENGIASDPEMGDAAWFRDPAGNWVCISSLKV